MSRATALVGPRGRVSRQDVCVPGRCVDLRIQLARESADGDASHCAFLLKEMDEHLLEIEGEFMSCGYRENCVDVRLKRAKIKR